MSDKKITPLSEAMLEAFSSKVSRLDKKLVVEQTHADNLQEKLDLVNHKMHSARMGGFGDLKKLSEEKSQLQFELAEAKKLSAKDMKNALTSDDAKAQPKDKVSLKKAPWDMKKEEVELEEATLPVAKIQKAVDDGKSMDVIMTMFANKRTTNTDEIRKVVKDYMWNKRMKKEALDPVGKEDGDIDNDGDTDKSDKYLTKRRAAIGKALKKEEVEELGEKVDNDYFHTSVEKGKFIKSKIGGSGNADTMFLHDLDNKGGDGKSPMLVTFAKQAEAEKAAKQHGGKIVKTGMGTFRIIKEEVALDEDVSKMSHGRLKWHMNTGVPHGSFTKDEMKKERDRRLKTGEGEAYKKAKMAMSESVELDEAAKYTIAHKTFSSAVQHAKDQVEKQGYTIDGDEWDRKVAMGPKKPGTGKTNRYTIELMKDGKPSKRMLQMQVYYDEGRYELNMYVS